MEKIMGENNYRDNVKMQRITNFTCDERISDALIELHDKGYYTIFSCSGHSDNKFPIPYILFDRIASIGLGTLMNENGSPMHWEVDAEYGKYNDVPYSYTITRHFSERELEMYSIEQLIDIAMVELKLWVHTLPHNSFDIYTTGTLKKLYND